MKPEPFPPFEPPGFHREPAADADRPPQGLLGASPAFERMVADIRMLARTDAPVFSYRSGVASVRYPGRRRAGARGASQS